MRLGGEGAGTGGEPGEREGRRGRGVREVIGGGGLAGGRAAHPSSADTSAPACVKRKMLSTKRSTSWPSTSRKYSATVSAVSATRARAPGGSFIWPYTSAAFEPPSRLITPECIISWYRSLPSRVRSPTPAKTEKPPCAFAMLLISSMITTVFPTPAPPKRPILPPLG